MDDTSLPLIVLQSEDKTMPLDLSCRKVADDDDDKEEDDVIVTLEIPGRTRHPRTHDTVVVVSDTDSDSDVTVLDAINVKTKTTTKRKSRNIKEPVDVSSDCDDCIVSSYHVPRNGIKRIYEDGGSLLTSGVLLDTIVKGGKDPFLSDASSVDDLSGVGLIIPSSGDNVADADDKNVSDFEDASPLSVRLGLLASKNLTGCSDAIADAAGIVLDSLDGDVTKSPNKSSVTSSSQQSIMSGSFDDLVTSQKSSGGLLLAADSQSEAALTFGITQLLSSSTMSNKASNAGAATIKESKSMSDLSAIFCVPSFDRLYSSSDDKRRSIVDVASVDVKPSNADVTLLSMPSTSSLIASRLHQWPNLTRLKMRTSLPTTTDINNAIHKNSTPGKSRVDVVASSLPNIDGDNDDVADSKSLSLPPQNAWKVVRNDDSKVILRRAVGRAASTSSVLLQKREKRPSTSALPSPQLNHKKLRLLPGYLPSSGHRPPTGFPAKVGDDLTSTLSFDDIKVESVVEKSVCYGCKQDIVVSQLSYCMAGHGCCGQCLQSQVKNLLARGKKGTLKCRYVACNSFYLVSQLRNSLPSMVVEILEEKLDREYCDNAAKLMMQDVGKVVLGTASDEDFDEKGREKMSKEEKEGHDLPKGWEPMSQSEEYRLVDVLRGSEEYNWVSAIFHQTMTRPRASVIKIQRLQNIILWEFYMVKKKQMERDNAKPVLEKNLFHGTHRNVVEAICRTNFDWRLCGSHGTMYGQGSYFARDAVYSHMYTDQPASRQPIPIHSSAPMMFAPPPSHHPMSGASGATAAAAQIIFQAFPGSSHSVSIAALQSCRFARLPVLNNGAHLSHPPPPPPPSPSAVQGVSSSSGPSSGQVPAYSFPYWVGNSNVPQQGGAAANKTGGRGGDDVASSHVHTMFLARVLVGEYTTGKSSYRKPPPVDPSCPYGRCYDACVNDTTNPTIYVIFNSAQSYPEYIIEYANKPRDAV